MDLTQVADDSAEGLERRLQESVVDMLLHMDYTAKRARAMASGKCVTLLTPRTAYVWSMVSAFAHVLS